MTRWGIVSILAGALVAGCQHSNEPRPEAANRPEEMSAQTLERRMTDLEAKLAPSPSAEARAESGVTSQKESVASTSRRAVSVPRPVARDRSAERVAPRIASATPPVERIETTPAAPRVEELVVPEGTELTLVLETGASSATSREGDPITARVERAIGPDGRVALPGGSFVKGRVTAAESSGRVKGRARLSVDFDQIVIRNRTYSLDATSLTRVAKSGVRRDAVVVGGSAAVGALIGGLADGGSGAKKGALIGATAGTGAVLATKGSEVVLEAGSRHTITVRDAFNIR